MNKGVAYFSVRFQKFMSDSGLQVDYVRGARMVAREPVRKRMHIAQARYGDGLTWTDLTLFGNRTRNTH